MRGWVQLTLVLACYSASTEAALGQATDDPSPSAFVFVQDQENPPRRTPTTPPSRTPRPPTPRDPRVPDTREQPRPSTTPTDDDLRSLFDSQETYSLASTPPMFGDVFFSLGRVTVIDNATGDVTTFDLPSAGGSRRVKIGENNSPIPGDRVVFMYNHFENVLRTEQGVFMNTTTTSVNPLDRYTIGGEKSFFDGIFSVEARMPFTTIPQVGDPLVMYDSGEIGNLAVILKALIYNSDRFALSAGVGLDLPTGSDVTSQSTTVGPAGTVVYNAQNDAFHILPYIGFTLVPNDIFWITGFAQIDLAANGNPIFTQEPGITPLEQVGVYTEQNLAYFDLAAGAWIYRNPCACWFTGLAATAEIHYNTAMQDTDEIFNAGANSTTLLNNPLGNAQGRFDIVHASVGIHAQVTSKTSVRIGGVLPVTDFPNRVMDSEVQVQVNRQF